ncbi:MAG: DUF4358 domain-containing protein [Oscillospiraceae bacterium]|nr:DUF4358 domain-containing protein [Oscillospiraceae bacterium]
MKKLTESALLCALALLIVLLSACGGTAAKDADLSAVWARMEKKFDLPAMSALSERQLERYYGIDTAACPQLVAMQCDDGLRVDEIWLIQAADEEAAEKLLALGRSRLDQLAAETENYLPEQYAVVQNSRALRIGCYVALLISPNAAEMEELFRGAF